VKFSWGRARGFAHKGGAALVHRLSWWAVAVTVLLAAAFVWIGGTWLFRAFLRLHGGH